MKSKHGDGYSSARVSDTFLLGNDLPVHRLGFGAMRITGKGVWDPPRDRKEVPLDLSGRGERIEGPATREVVEAAARVRGQP